MNTRESFPKKDIVSQIAAAQDAFADILKPTDGSLVPRLEEAIQSVNWPKKPDHGRFRRQHLEVLIDQAADLLDRGLRDRDAWQELQEKRFTAALALEEFANLDVIQREADAKKHDDALVSKSKAEMDAAIVEQTHLAAAKKTVGDILTELETTADRRKRLAMWAMWVPYWVHEPDNFMKVDGFDLPVEPMAGHSLKQIYNVVPTIARAQFVQELEDKKKLFTATSENAAAYEARSTGQAESTRLKYEFDEAELGFQRRRKQVSREIQAEKLLAWQSGGGALNYKERMEPIQRRFKQDFTEALERLLVAQQGLKEIYGYAEELPAPSDDFKLFDECLIWVRSAIHFVTAFNRTEEVLFCPISVRNIIGNDEWDKGKQLAIPSWTIHLNGEPGKNCLFGELGLSGLPKYVRLRGAAVYVNTTSHGTWRVQAQPPRQSYIQWDGDSTKRTLEQADTPPLLSLRTRDRRETYQTEMLGTSNLHNVGPFGDWHISMEKKSVEGINSATVDDILIDFYVITRLAP